MPQDPYRTYHANQALELSELVNLQFARVRFGAADPRLIRMREPDGPSTDSGRKARQPLVLLRDPSEESGLVFGFVDLFKRTADLKGYQVVRQQHEQRFGTSLGMTRSEYARLIDELKAFLMSQAIETRIVNHPRTPSSFSSAPPASWASAPSTLSPGPRPPRPPYGLAFVSAALGFSFCYLLVSFGLLPV